MADTMKPVPVPEMDIDGDRPGVQRKVAKSDIAWMIARRAAKAGTAAAIGIAAYKLGLSIEASIALGLVYMPVEKGANAAAEKRNGGKNMNFDLGTLLVAIIKVIWGLITRRKNE